MAIATVFKKHNEIATRLINEQTVKSYKDKIRKDYKAVEKMLTDEEFYQKKIMRVVKKHAENLDEDRFKIHTFNAITGRFLHTRQMASLKDELHAEYKIKFSYEKTGNDEAGTLYGQFMTEAEIEAELAAIKAEVEAEIKAEEKAEVKA